MLFENFVELFKKSSRNILTHLQFTFLNVKACQLQGWLFKRFGIKFYSKFSIHSIVSGLISDYSLKKLFMGCGDCTFGS